MGKVVTRFPTKRRKSPTLWGSTYLHGLCEGVPPGKINDSPLFDLQPRFFSLSFADGLGYDSSNCSRFWHVFDFDASTAKFKIYQNRLMSTVPTLPVKSIVNPNCSCTIKHEISSNDVISSAEKISTTAKNLMVDKLCVNEMKNIYDNASKCV